MAVLVIFTGKGITKQMYEDLRKDIRWEQDKPEGLILHAAGVDEADNMHVADVWESADKLNDFVNKRLAPAMQKRNAPQPQIETFQVHNINAFSAIDGYKLK